MTANRVIAVSGYPGGGKTSLVDAVASRLGDATVVYCDHYQHMTEKSADEIFQWLDDGSDHEQLLMPQVTDHLQCLKRGEPVTDPLHGGQIKPAATILFETLFGRFHKPSAACIDVLVWIDTPLDIALTRNIRKFTGMFLSEQQSGRMRENLQWLDQYLDFYLQGVRKALLLQKQKVAADADITIANNDDIDTSAALLLEKLLALEKLPALEKLLALEKLPAVEKVSAHGQHSNTRPTSGKAGFVEQRCD